MTLKIEHEISSLSGKTKVIGKVVDKDMKPINEVEITIADSKAFSDNEGIFLLEEVEQGWAIIEFYKEGYKPYRLGFIAYPQGHPWHKDNGSANHNYMNDPPIILQHERVYFEYDRLDISNGTKITYDMSEKNERVFLINITGYEPSFAISIEIESEEGTIRSVIEKNKVISNHIFNMTLLPPKFDLLISGRDILDLGILSIGSNNHSLMINITLKESALSQDNVENKVKANRIVALGHSIIGSLTMVGVYLVWRTSRWNSALFIIIISFFSRGPVDIFGININNYLSILAILLIIICRKEMSIRVK